MILEMIVNPKMKINSKKKMTKNMQKYEKKTQKKKMPAKRETTQKHVPELSFNHMTFKVEHFPPWSFL